MLRLTVSLLPTGWLLSGCLLWSSLSAAACSSELSFPDQLAPQSEGNGQSKDAGDAGTERAASSATAGRGEDPSSANNTSAGRGKSLCTPPQASENLRPRQSVMAGNDGVFARDLFDLFRSNCGGCHVEQAQGDWVVTTLDDFANKVDSALENIKSPCTDQSGAPGYDPMCTKLYMPPPGPNGMPYTDRDATDPIVELATLLEAWRDAGTPKDVFYPNAKDEDDTTAPRYVMDRAVGMAMTNIGNCVPQKAMVGSESDESDALDKMFADAKELPERLEQTDLTTLDAEPLAKRRVVAYAPTYTLWADNAQKLRMVRVPRGQTIAFDKDKQSFEVPANTRFYKTFMKRVVDLDGNESYRKIETRLIVSRPDKVNANGAHEPQALFGTYIWNEAETEAVLVRNPLRDGKPFRDRVMTYIIDEQKADSVVADAPKDLIKELEDRGLTRTYAIPGSARCVQCHMGAPNGSFVLGFTPLQINRQPMNSHGVIEPAARDELSQMQRLIDYKIISGMSSPSEVTLLEASQGDRKPRNNNELTAQGYMMGNCAHCHNPIGFPTISAPELRDLLDFWPSKEGGIFQFPLDRFSPRVFRGPTNQQRIPYITPSLYDLGESADGFEDGKKMGHYKPANGGEATDADAFYILAPWRSLVYRNVDGPFSYEDDSAIFPHMPRNTPGYDCRARQLLGTWMTSIPARPMKGFFDDEPSEVRGTASDLQPYVEVPPGDKDYERAVSDANKRVDGFKKSPRYSDCPDPKLDVIDPEIRDNAAIATPNASANNLAPANIFVDDAKWNYVLPIPSRGHWFVTDTTEAPGDWSPRRADWQSVIIDKDKTLVRSDEEANTLALLDTLHVTGNEELRAFALTDVPFGLWDETGKNCSFPSSVKRVSDIKPEDRPSWMKGIPGASPAPESAHVFSISPAAQVFETICRSCHGPQADSKSRLADTIADLTGGDTRVANLRDGLFGPNNRDRIFGPLAAAKGGSVDDWTTRYLAWMTLGGTKRYIPEVVIKLIGNAYVLGEKRGGFSSLTKGSGNMLETAKFLCNEVLPLPQFSTKYFDIDRAAFITPEYSEKVEYSSALIYRNGDGKLWEKMCVLQNPTPVRVLTVESDAAEPFFRLKINVTARDASGEQHDYDLFKRAPYGASPVGDQTGAVQPSLTDTNILPWCIRQPPDDTLKQKLESHWVLKHGAGTLPPYCPPAFLDETNRSSDLELSAWSKRGAMNAGLSVFLYLEALFKGERQRVPDYDRCDQLTGP